MLLHSVRHDWPEKAGFLISRPQGLGNYTFLHFSTPVQFRIHGELVQARPGACIFYTPGTPQWFHSPQEVIHNWLHAEPDLGDLLQKLQIPQNTLLYPADTKFISEIFRELEVEHFSDSPFKAELTDGYILEFLIKFSRALQADAPAAAIPRKARERLRAVRREILSQPEKRWTVAEMAQLASLSPSRFHAVYKSVFATSPMQDLIDAKIGYAKSLLLSDDQLPLPEVAEKLGYNDQYHFIRQFKTVTGVTPGAYRKANR